MADDRVPMTREGYDDRKAKLDRMRHVEMLDVTKRVATAREMGDLSENAEYHAAREDQGILQAKINQLSDELSLHVIMSPVVGGTWRPYTGGKQGVDRGLVNGIVGAVGRVVVLMVYELAHSTGQALTRLVTKDAISFNHAMYLSKEGSIYLMKYATFQCFNVQRPRER